MAGVANNLTRLLLLSFIRTGVDGDGGLLFVGQSFNIMFPCEKSLVCFHIWHFSTGETSADIAMAIIGETHKAKSEDEDSECSVQIEDLTEEAVGRHRCQQRTDDSSPYMAPATTQEFNLMPGKTVSLQCILLSYVQLGHCDTQERQVSLTWVDETDTEIQEDLQHQIKQQIPCDITLTVTFQSPQVRKFRCRAAADGQVQTSAELRITVPALKRKGRGLFVDLAPEVQGNSQDLTGAAVGVVGCVVLTALVAAFVVNKRRTRNQLTDESSNTTSTNNVTSADDVIYADITLPVGSDCVWTYESETTEYACVRYR